MSIRKQDERQMGSVGVGEVFFLLLLLATFKVGDHCESGIGFIILILV